MSNDRIVPYSTLPPHVQASFVPWEPNGELAAPPAPQGDLPQDTDFWNGDPGIYADPRPEIDPGIHIAPAPEDIDPGIRARPPMHAPSIVPGLDILRDSLERRREAAQSPAPASPGSARHATDGVASMTLGDHMGGGARGFLVPSLVGGAVGGALAAMAVSAAGHGPGVATAAFVGKTIGHTALGVATGAAAGLLVAATSPKDSDSLAARYAVAGGLIGAGAGASFPGGPNRAIGAVLGGISGAIVAGITGARMQRGAE